LPADLSYGRVLDSRSYGPVIGLRRAGVDA